MPEHAQLDAIIASTKLRTLPYSLLHSSCQTNHAPLQYGPDSSDSIVRGAERAKCPPGPWRDSGQLTLDGILSEACGVMYTHAAALAFFRFFYTGELLGRCDAHAA